MTAPMLPPPPDQWPDYMTRAQIADCAGISEWQVDQLIKRRKLPGPIFEAHQLPKQYEPVWSRTQLRPYIKALRAGSVYFILSETVGLLKIGFARDLRKRIKAIQTSSADKISLLAYVPGAPEDEKELHSRFAEYHEHGEWHRYEGALKEYVEAL